MSFGAQRSEVAESIVFEAVVMPDKTYALLGAIVMESLDLIIEPRGLGLYPNPRSDIPMAELK